MSCIGWLGGLAHLTGEGLERLQNSDETLNGQPAIAAALDPADVALVGADNARDLVLGKSVSLPQDAKFLAEGRDKLAPREVTPLNVRDCVLFLRLVDLKEISLLEAGQDVLIRRLQGGVARVLSETTYGHWQPPGIHQRPRRPRRAAGE